MKVYVITDGGYDNCGVVGVTTNKIIAEEFVKEVVERGLNPELNTCIEEYNSDALQIGFLPFIKEGYRQYHVRYYFSTGQFVISPAIKLSLRPNKFANLDGYTYGLVWAKTSEEALKLVKDYSNEITKE